MKAREVKRRQMAAKYAAKREALKQSGDYIALDKLPRTLLRYVSTNRCKLTGSSPADTCASSAFPA